MLLTTIVSAVLAVGATITTPIAMFASSTYTHCDAAIYGTQKCDPWVQAPADHFLAATASSDALIFFFAPNEKKAANLGVPWATVLDDEGWDCDDYSCEWDLTNWGGNPVPIPQMTCPDAPATCPGTGWPNGGSSEETPTEVAVCLCWGSGNTCVECP